MTVFVEDINMAFLSTAAIIAMDSDIDNVVNHTASWMIWAARHREEIFAWTEYLRSVNGEHQLVEGDPLSEIERMVALLDSFFAQAAEVKA